MKLLRTLLTLCVLVVLLYVAATVKLGSRTFFGHVARIWRSDETQDLVHGVKESSGPALRKVERGVKAGIEEARKDEPGGAEPAPDGEQASE